MRKLLFPALLLVLTASCSAPRLYYWGSNGTPTKYEQLAYLQSEKQTPKSICDLVCLYEDMVSHPGGTRKTPPPGICAEYGYLLLQPSTAEYFAQYATSRQRKLFGSDIAASFLERGLEMLAKEMELYPESAKFIAPLLKKAKGGAK